MNYTTPLILCLQTLLFCVGSQNQYTAPGLIPTVIAQKLAMQEILFPVSKERPSIWRPLKTNQMINNTKSEN